MPTPLGRPQALALRAGLPDTSGLPSVPDDHDAWEATANYLGALCANLVLTVSPHKIVLSGEWTDLAFSMSVRTPINPLSHPASVCRLGMADSPFLRRCDAAHVALPTGAGGDAATLEWIHPAPADCH
eukprot:scaffold74826_cov40-Tisochrysis_lutea.AAC.2